MNKIFMWLIVGVLVLSACGPSAADIQQAIEQTQAAQPTTAPTSVPPTDTQIPAPTITPLPPTDTPEPTATETPLPTATPTPDTRVIKIDPQNFLLQKEDLPAEGKYYLPNAGWISPHHNSELISQMGAEAGREYLDRTGRIDGWVVAYKRGTSTVIMPEEIFSNLVMYEAAEGAQLTVTDYNLAVTNAADGWEYMDGASLELGDVCVVVTRKELQSSGKSRVWLRIMFAYRNFLASTQGWGWEDEVRLEFVEAAARLTLEKLMTAELSEP